MAYARSLLGDPAEHETLLAWSCSSCIGIATLAFGSTSTADLGVLVEDAWQCRGVGTRLVASLVLAALRRAITTVHADVLCDDLFILQTLRRMGPLTVSSHVGTFSVDVHLITPGGFSVPQPEGPTLPRGPAPPLTTLFLTGLRG